MKQLMNRKQVAEMGTETVHGLKKIEANYNNAVERYESGLCTLKEALELI